MAKPTENNKQSGSQAAEPSQAELSRQALDMKEAGAKPEPHPVDPSEANAGMASLPREGYPPSGALDAEGQRPVLERSRKVR